MSEERITLKDEQYTMWPDYSISIPISEVVEALRKAGCVDICNIDDCIYICRDRICEKPDLCTCAEPKIQEINYRDGTQEVECARCHKPLRAEGQPTPPKPGPDFKLLTLLEEGIIKFKEATNYLKEKNGL